MTIPRLALVFALLAAFAALTACERKSVGSFSNDWTGNDIVVEAITDPKVHGVTCHFTYFNRGLIDRVTKGNWFENPSNTSIACRQTGALVIGDIDMSKAGEEVFSQRASALFKRIAVRRIYDPQNKTLIYVAHSREIIEGSAKMSLSTIALYGQDVTWSGKPPAQ